MKKMFSKVIIDNMTKKCFCCGEIKVLEEFYKHKTGKYGRRAICIECYKKKQQLYRNTHSEKEINRHRQYRKSHRATLIKSNKQYRKKIPELEKAYNAVHYALQIGKISRLPCQFCGSTKNVQAHHEDYFKPLEITWLCPACHAKVHNKYWKVNQLQESHK